MEEETIRSVGDASKEVAKTTGKGIDLAASVGKFIYRIIGEPFEELAGTAVTDPLKEYRKRRLHALQLRTEKIISEREITETRPIPAKVSVPLLEAASLEDDEDVMDVWARLLAAGLDPNEPEISKRQISVLSELSAQAIRLVMALGENVSDKTLQSGSISRKAIKSRGVNSDEIDHLISLGLLKFKMESAGQAEGADYENGEMVYVDLQFELPDEDQLLFTDFGKRLFEKIRDK